MSQYDHDQQRVSLRQTPDSAVEIENMHDIFQDPYRCAVLQYLQLTEGPVTLHELARIVEEWNPGSEATENISKAHPRTWLRDNHVLPMDRFGVIEYDPDTDVVHLSDDVILSVTPPCGDG